MNKDKLSRHGIFGLALAGLVVVAMATGNDRPDSNYEYDLDNRPNHEDYDDGDYERPSGDSVTQNRDVAGFDRIQIRGGMEITVNVGGDFNVDVSADDNRIDHLETFVEGSTLIIEAEKKGNKRFWNDADIEVTISMPSLSDFEVRGAIDGDITGVDSENIAIEIKGAGELDVSGKCGSLDLKLSGAGDIDTRNLLCSDVDVRLAGAGEINAYASESVDARLGGIGNIEIYGNPKTVNKKTGGLGVIQIKD